jgi:hypothetical protein
MCFFCPAYLNILLKSHTLYEAGWDGYHNNEESLQWVEALLELIYGKGSSGWNNFIPWVRLPFRPRINGPLRIPVMAWPTAWL